MDVRSASFYSTDCKLTNRIYLSTINKREFFLAFTFFQMHMLSTWTFVVPRRGPPPHLTMRPFLYWFHDFKAWVPYYEGWLDGVLPLEFINIQPLHRGSASRIHQHQPENGGSASRDNFYESRSMWSRWISRCYLSRRQGCFGSSNKTAITFKYRSSRESWVGPFACTTDIKGDIILQKSPKYANCCRPQTHTHSLTHNTSVIHSKKPRKMPLHSQKTILKYPANWTLFC